MRSVRLLAILLLVGTLGPASSAQVVGLPDDLSKLDVVLHGRAARPTGKSRVILRAKEGHSLTWVNALIAHLGGSVDRPLPIVHGEIVTVPNTALRVISLFASVSKVSLDRPIVGAMERTGLTIGSRAVRDELGLDGSGVGVAVIDSGVSPSHDDLADAAGAQRVDRFVDFVGGGQAAYDDYGHGTHVAGIVAGNGFDSSGKRAGVAPGAHLVVLKVLDGTGHGNIGDVIAALDYVVAHKDELNIRVVNLSIAAGVYESYDSDPLALAALAAVRAGIVVVAASGNLGHSADGKTLYGGVTAPGNAPWVLTVGGSSHMGTVNRADDTMARFSSRGPTAIDANAKPDLVAPSVGIESLSEPGSRFYTAKSQYLLSGTISTSYLPYLSLSGTSMASPVVAGTVALMLQANPSLTPNAVKAILQYTAQTYDGYDPLTQGAGFLNAKGAVTLARYLADPANVPDPTSGLWSGHIIWGNRSFVGGRLTADANAWATDVTWGSSAAPSGEGVAFGVICSVASCVDGQGTWSAWGVSTESQNIVWGNLCDGGDCQIPWSLSSGVEAGTVVWGTDDGDGDTVVWGTDDGDDDTVVWGTGCDDWSCEPIVWPSE